jgi:Kef-type K+ transport system membrane component KefB
MKSVALYLLLVGLPFLGILGVLRAGTRRAAVVSSSAAAAASPSPAAVPRADPPKAAPAAETALVILLQIGAILLVSRLVGRAFRFIGQPQVVGEMAAGILLGPSLLGWVAPKLSAAIFPAASMGFLNTLCQLGLVLFMFLVGLELDPRLLKGRGHIAVVTSHVSIIAPFLMGTTLALALYPRLAPPGVEFSSFALFLGAAMSITAFPVLARILAERRLQQSAVGAITLACAAVDDVSAWCILAVVVAIARAEAGAIPLVRTLAGSALFIAAMLTLGRRALAKIETAFHRRGAMTHDLLALVLLVALAAAGLTQWLGIHALFGAFLSGAVMPKDRSFTRALLARVEDLVVVLFLPLFFAFTGLRTRVALLSDGSMWAACAAIILVAIAGKLGGSALAARSCSLPWREAATVGILMNTRGLMELVILNIGLEIGVVSPALFAMMVLMALTTTFMTTPLLDRVYPGSFRERARQMAVAPSSDA